MPPAGAPGKFEFPVAATKTLANGIKIFVVTDHSEPAVAVQMVILSAGSTKDSAKMPGVAQMTASLLSQGTEKRSAQELAEAIDFVGRFAERVRDERRDRAFAASGEKRFGHRARPDVRRTTASPHFAPMKLTGSGSNCFPVCRCSIPIRNIWRR